MLWNDESTLPKYAKLSYEEYKRINPNWNVMLHIGLDDVFDKSFKYYDMYKKMYDMQLSSNKCISRLSDVLRQYFIHRYGGIWVDCDTWPLKPFDGMYKKSFSARLLNSSRDIRDFYCFGCFDNRDEVFVKSIQTNIDKFPLCAGDDAYHGFSNKTLYEPLKDYILCTPETTTSCQQFKDTAVLPSETIRSPLLRKFWPELDDRRYIRHFECEMRFKAYKDL